MDPEAEFSSFRPVPRTGVIFVNEAARQKGYGTDGEAWCNLGQGQPEAGALAGAPARRLSIEFSEDDNEYAPVAGLWELREVIADLYNDLYRCGRGSKYTAENVAVSGGGRLGLTRIAASLGHINLGHFLPDYTAYEELLDTFRLFTPIPILLESDRGYEFTTDELRREILGRGLGAILLSNPCNPTGRVIAGQQLGEWLRAARELDCTMIMDEFYSNYIWTGDGPSGADEPNTVSAAEFVNDVNRDPAVIINGLTKNMRYPGWRLGWVVAPKAIIESVSSAGSFLDGGSSRPLQRAAIDLLSVEDVLRETRALRAAFVKKRAMMVSGLRSLGIGLDLEPQGTFYAWGNLGGLSGGLDDGMTFLERALEHRLIVVPGEFFDVNPGRRRPGRASRFRNYARFSFGAPAAVVQEGLTRLRSLIDGATDV